MTSVTRALRFRETLIRPPERPTCPKGGSPVWTKHGFRHRGQRCLDRRHRAVPIQRDRCLNPAGHKTWSEHPPWLRLRRWSGREVIRTSRDGCVACTTSGRELAAVLRAAIAGTGRARRGAQWRRPKKDTQTARWAHPTIWRGFHDAATRAQTPERQADRSAGLFARILAADEAGAGSRGSWTASARRGSSGSRRWSMGAPGSCCA